MDQEQIEDLHALEEEVEVRVDRIRALSEEVQAVRRDLAESRTDAARAARRASRTEAELQRLKRRRMVRLVEGLARRRRRLVTALGRNPVTGEDLVAAAPVDQGAGPSAVGPVASRASLAARIRPPSDAEGLRLDIRWPSADGRWPGLPEREAVESASHALGWRVIAPGQPADAILSFDPAFDVRTAPDGVIKLGWIASAAHAGSWLEEAWFDELDLVFAPPAAEAAIARDSVHVPVSTAGGLDATMQTALLAWLEQTHVDVAIGPRNWETAPSWGDYYFGRALQRALIRRGAAARIRLRDAWSSPAASAADAVIHLFGRSRRPLRADQVNVLWIISHPDLVTDDMLTEHDLVFAASDSLAAALTKRSGRPVLPLHQATDPDRFHATTGGPPHDLIFVGGYRPDRRPVVDELAPTPLDLAVYGHGWTSDVLDERHLAGGRVPNRGLAAYYSAAKIVLNDHWADMAEWSVFSNRLYDAAACGAFVLSDHVDGIEEEFDGGIATFRSGTELRRLARRYLAAPEVRAEMAHRAWAAVVARHTFAHRAKVLVDAMGPLLVERRGPGAGVGRG